MSKLRSVPVDLLRGFAVWLMLFNANRIDKQGWWRQFGHGERFVPTLVDWTYPLFLFCAGIALSYSLERSLAQGMSRADFFRRLIFRAIRLFLAGVFLNALPRLDSLPIFGTLQCIAAALLIAGAISCFTGYRLALIGAVVIQLAAYLVSEFPPASIDWMTRWNPDQTLLERVDLALIGRTGGMEGILTTVVAASFVLSGIAAKPFLGSKGILPAGAFLIAAAVALALGPAPESSIWVPFVSQTFSLSFSLLCTGLSLVSVSLLGALQRSSAGSSIGSAASRVIGWLLLPFGRNAILAFFGVNAFRKIFLETCLLSCPDTVPNFKRVVFNHLAALFGAVPANFLYTGLLLGGGWLLCAVLLKKEIIVRI